MKENALETLQKGFCLVVYVLFCLSDDLSCALHIQCEHKFVGTLKLALKNKPGLPYCVNKVFKLPFFLFSFLVRMTVFIGVRTNQCGAISAISTFNTYSIFYHYF